MAWLDFWWRCITTGWTFGTGVHGFFESAIILLLCLGLRKKRGVRKKWENWATKHGPRILLWTFIGSTLLVGPYLEFKGSLQQQVELSTQLSVATNRIAKLDESPPLKVDVTTTDTEARKQLEVTQRELAEARGQLLAIKQKEKEKLAAELAAPVRSGRTSIEIKFRDKDSSTGPVFVAENRMVLVRNRQPALVFVGNTSRSFRQTPDEKILQADVMLAPSQSAVTVAALAELDVIQLRMNALPNLGSLEISAGHVEILVNSITMRLAVPAQTAHNRTIFISDMKPIKDTLDALR